MHISFRKNILIILRSSTKHAKFWFGMQYILKCWQQLCSSYVTFYTNQMTIITLFMIYVIVTVVNFQIAQLAVISTALATLLFHLTFVSIYFYLPLSKIEHMVFIMKVKHRCKTSLFLLIEPLVCMMLSSGMLWSKASKIYVFFFI